MRRRFVLGAAAAAVAAAAIAATSSATPASFYRAICVHHTADGKSWYGPERRNSTDAEADCFNHHRKWPLHECRVKFFHRD